MLIRCGQDHWEQKEMDGEKQELCAAEQGLTNGVGPAVRAARMCHAAVICVAGAVTGLVFTVWMYH